MLNQLQAVFKSLHCRDVRYVVVGGIAAVLYGVPRVTFDLDLLIDPTRENAAKMLDAFEDAGLATAMLIKPESLLDNEITVFNDRVRIDVLTSIPGGDFQEIWKRRETMNHREQEFYVISRRDLIATKLASGRPVDIDDVKMLQSGTPNDDV